MTITPATTMHSITYFILSPSVSSDDPRRASSYQFISCASETFPPHHQARGRHTKQRQRLRLRHAFHRKIVGQPKAHMLQCFHANAVNAGGGVRERAGGDAAYRTAYQVVNRVIGQVHGDEVAGERG